MLFGAMALLAGRAIMIGAEAPPADGHWRPVAEFTDGFDGTTLDAAKWHAQDPVCKGRRPVFFDPACVHLQDGTLSLMCRPEPVTVGKRLPDDRTLPAVYEIGCVRAWQQEQPVTTQAGQR